VKFTNPVSGAAEETRVGTASVLEMKAKTLAVDAWAEAVIYALWGQEDRYATEDCFNDVARSLLETAAQEDYGDLRLPAAAADEVRRPGASWWEPIAGALIGARLWEIYDEGALLTLLELTVGLCMTVRNAGVRAIRPSPGDEPQGPESCVRNRLTTEQIKRSAGALIASDLREYQA
jgi:hypothetical protein